MTSRDRAPLRHRPLVGAWPGLLALAAVALLGSCEGSSVGLDEENDTVRLGAVPVTVAVAPIIPTLTITVSAADIATDLVFNVTMVDGTASDTITIPVGSNRTITVRGFDTSGIETHRGVKIIDVVEGPNPSLTIVLSGLTSEVPIAIGLGGIVIAVELSRDTLVVGGTAQAVATVTDQVGDTLPIAVRWAASNPAIAAADSTGRLVGVGPGVADVVATFRGTAGSASVTVVEPEPVDLSLSPDSSLLSALGDTLRLSARVVDQFGDTIFDATVDWASDDEAVAVVEAGLVTAVGNGTATIEALSDSLVATATVVVQQSAARIVFDVSAVSFVALGDTSRIAAVVEDSGGSAIEGATVSWSSADTTVALVSDGLVQALATGTTEVVATHDSVSAAVPVQVSQVAASVAVTPDSVVFYDIGQSLTLVASELDAGGSSMPSQTGWVWNSDFDGVASIDPTSGVVSALGYGTAGITAQRAGSSLIGRATVTVALTGSSLTLSRASATLAPGDTVHVEARVFDSGGAELWDRHAYVEWVSSDPSVASVEAGCAQAQCDGVITAHTLGTATITATSGTATGSLEVTITDRLPASVTISPTSATLTTIGEDVQFSATVLDSDGVEIPEAPIAWSSTEPTVATVDQAGLVTAASNGSTVITAASGSVFAEAPVTVASAGFNMAVAGVQLNQGNQGAAGDIPGVAGRPGLLRVLVQAGEENSYMPSVRVGLYDGGQLIRQVTVDAPRQGVPTVPNLAVASDTWNVVLDSTDVVANLDIVVELDPDNLIPESNESDNVYAGPLDMRTLAPLRIVFFPIESLVHGTVGNISLANASSMLASAEQWIPTSSTTYEVRDPFVTSEDLSTGDGWSNLLAALQAVRTAEGAADQYYHGIIGDFSSPAYGGLAYLPPNPTSPYRSGLSYDRLPYALETIAHELGHNLGRPHAPCGNPANVEAAFPYPDGTIGQPGYDIGTQTLVAASTFDYMSYCDPAWTSDWAFGQIVSWRTDDPLVPVGSPDVGAGDGRGLLLYGRIGADGVRLEPAFTVDVGPAVSLPAPGVHEIRGISEDGDEIFRVSFDGVSVEDGAPGLEEHFSFVVPLAESQLSELARLEVISPAGGQAISAAAGLQVPPGPPASLTVDSDGRLSATWSQVEYPAAMIRDVESGTILGIVKGGEAVFDSRGRPLEAIELILSNGVRSVGTTPPR